VAALHYWLGHTYTTTLLLANVLPGLWLVVFHLVLGKAQPSCKLPFTSYTALPVDPAGVPSCDTFISFRWFHEAPGLCVSWG
jgi:hypothetical protein